MPIPFDQVGTPIAQTNQRPSAATSASDAPRLHRCSVEDFLGVAGPMGIGMQDNRGLRFYTAIDGVADGIPFTFSGKILRNTPQAPDGARPPLLTLETIMVLVCLSPVVLVAAGVAAHSQGRCFVTTAAFGDPQHPMVQQFRHLRDSILANYRLGQRFISWYNRRGPQLASLIEGRPLHRFMVRNALRPIAWGILGGRQFNNAARFFRSALT